MATPVGIRPGWRRGWAWWLAALARGRERHPPAREPRPDEQAATGSSRSLHMHEFERFFREHEPQVSSFLYRMTGDAGIAGDLSQETLFRAWQHFERIRAYDQPSAWLIRVATNLALQHLRRRAAPVGAASSLDEAYGPSESDPGLRFALRDLVRETLLELPPRPR